MLKYVAVDDIGTVLNPLLAEGQVIGGVVQGIAEALYEEAVYDDDGNLVSSTMTTYAIPRAPDVPSIEVGMPTSTPSTTNELGIKGVGETGTIASPPAVLNAVVDAHPARGHPDRASGDPRDRLEGDPRRPQRRRCGMIPARSSTHGPSRSTTPSNSSAGPTTRRSSPAVTRSCR